MWCDHFDMDLYNAIPAAREILAPLAGTQLYTYGNQRHGALDHPSCWNSYHGLIAFFGFRPVGIKPQHFYTDTPLVQCTFEEAVRDCWPHTYGMVMIAAGRLHTIWDSQLLIPEFDAIMGHVRGYGCRPDDEITDAREHVLTSLVCANANLRVLMALCGLSPSPLEGEGRGEGES